MFDYILVQRLHVIYLFWLEMSKQSSRNILTRGY